MRFLNDIQIQDYGQQEFLGWHVRVRFPLHSTWFCWCSEICCLSTLPWHSSVLFFLPGYFGSISILTSHLNTYEVYRVYRMSMKKEVNFYSWACVYMISKRGKMLSYTVTFKTNILKAYFLHLEKVQSTFMVHYHNFIWNHCCYS